MSWLKLYTVTELKKVAEQPHPKERISTTVKVGTAQVTCTDLVDWLHWYFKEDEKRVAVRVVIGDEDIGIVRRSPLLKLVDSRAEGDKRAQESETQQGAKKNQNWGQPQSGTGIGWADHASLPGIPTLNLIELTCEIPGCDQRMWVMVYDENNRPHCPVHKKHPLMRKVARWS